MPFVTVTSLLKNVGVVSCTGNLFQSLENLSEAHLIPSQNTDELLKPILKWEKVSVLLQTHACLRPVPAQKKLYICQSNHRTMKKSVSYMVTDDLLVTTWSMISGIDLLKGKIEDIGVLEDTVVDIGLDELRSSFLFSIFTLFEF
ncbi:hypothetical protein CUMW_088430 [Citrus unshiu]|nr:hypothetical protein CUMW_088430 [Citrus unshiu]